MEFLEIIKCLADPKRKKKSYFVIVFKNQLWKSRATFLQIRTMALRKGLSGLQRAWEVCPTQVASPLDTQSQP